MTDKLSSRNPHMQMAPSGMPMLDAIAVTKQTVIDVKPPAGQLYPASLHTLVITNAGERKTVIDLIVRKHLPMARKRSKK